ncbi:ABC transporter permease [Pyxidicoccus parkwayensis]|uniref:ABC transporter permease n=1 Tax=Pyxidicoccus parkwayensis TaxID=2813578 RepID=A0ABX7NWX2_9BACT|nr:FtsX-like permease family protein [Pyxidicoccus parkwaysis]QSQ21967.1 ABC transporter permease [Pyxidicoccus parkwaysis]
MSPLLTLAVRNLTRSKARNAITTGAILFGVAVSLFLGARIKGMQNATIDDVVDARVGAIQVHRRGYFDLKENQPLKLDLPQDPALEAKLRAVPGVREVMPRIAFSGQVSNGSRATLIAGQGMDPARELAVLPLAHREVRGRPLSAEVPQGAVMGQDLANALELKPGASLVLQATTQKRKENAVDLDLVGTVISLNPQESKRTLNLTLVQAQRLLRMDGRVTEYVVAVKNRDEVDAVAARLRTELGDGYEVHTWAELRPTVVDRIRIQQTMLTIIVGVCVILAVFGVANAMWMSVKERTREIGTMLAMGIRRWEVGGLFLLEAALQALLGGALGAGLVFAQVAVSAAQGGIQTTLPGGTAPLTIIPTIAPGLLAAVLLTSTLGAVVASVFPALRAARLHPVEALRSL